MRHQKKRWFAALLALCMLLSILPSTSLAFSESEETWSGNRRNQTIDGGTHTITLSNLTIDSPGVEKSAIDITGNADVTFILEGNNTLSGYRNHPAIWVESGSSVTFEGNGLLEASAGGASIGLGRPESAVDMAPAVILAISPSTVVPSLPEAPEAARASAAATRSAAGL